MKPCYFLILAILFVSSSAFFVPKDTRDGHYIHRLDENGTHTHTLLHIPAVPVYQNVSHNEILPRSSRSVFTKSMICGNDDKRMYRFPQEEIEKGMAMFKQGCGSHDLRNELHDYYVVSGKVVFFMCNYSYSGMLCKNFEFDECLGFVKQHCGDHSGRNSGYFQYYSRNKRYGFDLATNNICR